MSVEYTSRDGWRPRGRPRIPADPKVCAQLDHTRRSGDMARLVLPAGTTAGDVREVLASLRRAADELGVRLRVQPRRAPDIVAEGELRFYAEEA